MKLMLCKHETGTHLWDAVSGRTLGGVTASNAATAEVERCPLHPLPDKGQAEDRAHRVGPQISEKQVRDTLNQKPQVLAAFNREFRKNFPTTNKETH